MNKEILATKKKQITEIASILKDAKSFLFFDYLGLSAKKMTAVRRQLHALGGKIYIEKNNIFNRALEENKIKDFDELVGPSALICSCDDEIAPFKAVYELSKEFNFVKFKGGFLENKFVASEQIKDIATLPSRDELYSMFLSVLQGPIRNFLYALKGLEGSKK
jgi:large subunit ribosomal protein L10